MTHWTFVSAAYATTGIGTLLLLAWTVANLRRAEASAHEKDVRE